VTHAHSDHVGRHQTWIASPGTAALSERRWGARDLEVHEFGAPWQDEETTLTLLPAGHILGSAMVLLEHQGQRILYTGDFRLRHSATAEPCTPVPADVLVMECTYGEPRFRFPDRERELDRLGHFVATALARDEVPVLLAYSLGKAQEVARLMGDRGYAVALYGAAFEMLEVYRERGVRFARCEPYSVGPLRDTVLIVPPHLASSAMVRRLVRRRVAFLSGWALDSSRSFVPRCDATFAISDHADFDELLEMVARVSPRRVLTLHGPDRFADELRARGIDAEPASRAVQLRLF
jgi:Cft2 family RNA processing exonuclease